MIKIGVVGPESTGKSAMAQYLAKERDTLAIPEYARYYCKDLNRQYTLQDEVNMYYGQIALEEAMLPLAQHGIVLCDTTILTIKIWCDHLFGSTPTHVLEEIKARKYDGYLLMDTDLPWEDDPLRDFPNERPHFMQIWQKELIALEADYVIVSGIGQTRFDNGSKALKDILEIF